MVLVGFRSRCTIPAWCALVRASAICTRINVAGGIGGEAQGRPRADQLDVDIEVVTVGPIPGKGDLASIRRKTRILLKWVRFIRRATHASIAWWRSRFCPRRERATPERRIGGFLTRSTLPVPTYNKPHHRRRRFETADGRNAWLISREDSL
jgi:hypothetical protein